MNCELRILPEHSVPLLVLRQINTNMILKSSGAHQQHRKLYSRAVVVVAPHKHQHDFKVFRRTPTT
jgi:hypothetical protein